MEAAGNRLNMVIPRCLQEQPLRRDAAGPEPWTRADGCTFGLAHRVFGGARAGGGRWGGREFTVHGRARDQALVEPGLKVEDVFKRVRVAVETETNEEQTPWESSSLRGDFYFVAKVEEPQTPEPSTHAVPATVSSDPAARAYEAAERTQTIAGYQLVVDRFPGTFYADLAKEQIAKLGVESPELPATTPESLESMLGLSRPDRRRVQKGLASLGFNPGPPDGLFGKRTREGIRRYQGEKGFDTTGYLNAEQSQSLVGLGEEAERKEVMGTLADALSAADGIERGDWRASAFSAIAIAQAKLGDGTGAGRSISQALSAVQGIERADRRPSALTDIAVAQAKVGDGAGATRSLSKALSAVEHPELDSERAFALSGIAIAQAKAGDISGALHTARRIEEVGLTAAALGGIAGEQAESGDASGAARSISEALGTVPQIQRFWLRAEALSAIANAQAKVGDRPGAARSISDALSVARRPESPDWLRVWAFGFIAETQVETGDRLGAARSISEALIASRLEEEDWARDLALSAIARAQAKAGEISRALSTARRIAIDGIRLTALSVVAEVQARAQARAGGVLEALSTARRIEEDWPRALALSAIATVQAEAVKHR